MEIAEALALTETNLPSGCKHKLQFPKPNINFVSFWCFGKHTPIHLCPGGKQDLKLIIFGNLHLPCLFHHGTPRSGVSSLYTGDSVSTPSTTWTQDPISHHNVCDEIQIPIQQPPPGQERHQATPWLLCFRLCFWLLLTSPSFKFSHEFTLLPSWLACFLPCNILSRILGCLCYKMLPISKMRHTAETRSVFPLAHPDDFPKIHGLPQWWIYNLL